MEKSIVLLAGLLLSFSAVAQTKVVKANAVKANDYGVAYSLPKTELVVDAEVTKVTCKAGPYYQYAEKYLGVKKVNIGTEIKRSFMDTFTNLHLQDKEAYDFVNIPQKAKEAVANTVEQNLRFFAEGWKSELK